MAKTATSKPSTVTIGSKQTTIKTVVVDNGNNTYSLETRKFEPSGPVEGVLIATAEPNGTLKPSATATPEEIAAISNPNSQLRSVITQQKTSDSVVNELGINTPEKKAALDKAGGGSGNSATGGGGTNPSAPPENQNTQVFADENKSFREKTRLLYGDARYPLDLALEFQDCIKFSILSYRPSLAGGQGGQGGTGEVSRLVTIDKGNPTIGKERLGTITLPIPAGITDNNTVGWQEDTINDLQKSLSDITQKYIIGGTEAAGPALNNATDKAKDATQSGDLQKAISAQIAGFATQTDKLQQRAYGSMFNNNLELLFNGPGLRSFSFGFKLSPRSPQEAKEVMKIIRFFKQAMSVKRSNSSILLKTPRTFAISYMSSNEQHPYLNKFKECALTSMNVDYTPDGQYMTYMSSKVDERSMISYNLTLSFQELEPVFDDEYGNESTITNIGY